MTCHCSLTTDPGLLVLSQQLQKQQEDDPSRGKEVASGKAREERFKSNQNNN